MPRTSAPRRIAVFLQSGTEHGRGVLRGIAQFFRNHPDVTVLKFGHTGGYRLPELQRLGVGGVIAKVATSADERVFVRLGIPVVNVSGQCATPHLYTVNTDDLLVGRVAAGHLLSRGYRRLAFYGTDDHLASRLRRKGFEQGAKERGVGNVLSRSVPRPEGAGAGSAEDLARFLRQLPHPVGIFGFTDPAAIEVADACSAAGLRVPEDAAVLGVGNDLTRLEFAHVDVSSIQLNTQRIGQMAAEMLFDLIEGRAPPAREVLLPPVKIATRRSTDQFAVDDEAVNQALEHIRENVSNTIYVADVAKAAGVSRRVLELKFRRHLRTSIYAEVQRAHFEHAIELMSEPDLTISEIAYASGFDSAQRFSTAFSRTYGSSPLRYRSALQAGGARGA